jgi:hypothetical protein
VKKITRLHEKFWYGLCEKKSSERDVSRILTKEVSYEKQKIDAAAHVFSRDVHECRPCVGAKFIIIETD